MRSSLYVLSIALLAVLSFSCSKEMSSIEYGKIEEIVFTAVSGDLPTTRTTLKTDGEVFWCPFDSVKVFQGDLSSGKFIAQNSLESPTVKFKGLLESFYGAIENGGTNSYYWAVNPYSHLASCDGESVSLSIPETQVGVAGSFDPLAFPSVAKSQNQMLAFYNVCGGIKFTVSQKGIKSVTVSGNNGEVLSGRVKVSFNEEGRPFVQSVINGSTSVTITSPSDDGFAVGTPYYISLLPKDLSNGFSLVFSKGLSEARYITSSSVTVNRSRFGVITDKDAGLAFNYTNAFVEFSDPVAKAACLEHFDTNQDGKVSYEEAGTVTSLSTLFDDYVGVESFDELRFFENVSDLAGAFDGCFKLKSITIPKNITLIGDNAFNGCTALSEVVIPDSVTEIGASAFKGCASLNDFILPNSIRVIGDSAFQGCPLIEQMIFPESVSSIGSNVSSAGIIFLKGSTPPSIESDSFNVGTVFYVPYVSLDIYKAKKNWISHEDNIYPELVELSSDETSNCYIVSERNAYRIKTVQGNSNTSVGNVSIAEVLWETFGTDVRPEKGDIIKIVSFDSESIDFWYTGKKGNAVIAAKNADGTILWSWHIWCTDKPVDQVYPHNAGTMMDRNLGATSTTPGDPRALGLLYQWGRKDPFLSSSSVSAPIEALSTLDWPSPVTVNSSVGTIQYTIQHPTTFILRTLSNLDWMYSYSSYAARTRWLKEKTIYDPCPQGYHMPAGDENGVWAVALQDSYQGELIEGVGVSLSVNLNLKTLCWYPFPYAKDRYTGELTEGSAYWSYSPSTQGSDYNAYTMNVYSDGTFASSNGVNVRSRCFAVRCQKIE